MIPSWFSLRMTETPECLCEGAIHKGVLLCWWTTTSPITEKNFTKDFRPPKGQLFCTFCWLNFSSFCELPSYLLSARNACIWSLDICFSLSNCGLWKWSLFFYKMNIYSVAKATFPEGFVFSLNKTIIISLLMFSALAHPSFPISFIPWLSTRDHLHHSLPCYNL